MASFRRAIGFAVIAVAVLSATAGRGADAPEKQQATGLYGRNYAVVAPIYTGAVDGNVSYLRLINDNASASTFIVNVVGSPSGRVYGTANISVSANSSPQFAIGTILSLATASALNGGDTAYAFYLQDADQVAFQHVIYSSASGFFENASVCEYAMLPNQPILHNVHTSQLSSYPAQVVLHNFYNGAVSYHLQVSDSATGAAIGSVPIQAAGNSTTIVTEAALEQQLNWTPSAAQPHVTVTLTADGFTSAPAVLVDLIANSRLLNATVNMTAICAVNDNAGTCVHDPNGQSHACTQGSNIVGGALSAATYTLGLSSGSGSVTLAPQGITCESGGQCNILLNAGSATTLMATPATGTQFLGWSGACSGTDTCTLTMSGNQSVTASFSSIGY